MCNKYDTNDHLIQTIEVIGSSPENKEPAAMYLVGLFCFEKKIVTSVIYDKHPQQIWQCRNCSHYFKLSGRFDRSNSMKIEAMTLLFLDTGTQYDSEEDSGVIGSSDDE